MTHLTNEDSKSKAIKFLNSLITDETQKCDLDIIKYIKKVLNEVESSKPTKENEDYIRELFLKFYDKYKRKGGKEQAYKTWRKKLIKIKNKDGILHKARKIAVLCLSHQSEWERNGTEMQYIPMCSTWLNANIPD